MPVLFILRVLFSFILSLQVLQLFKFISKSLASVWLSFREISLRNSRILLSLGDICDIFFQKLTMAHISLLSYIIFIQSAWLIDLILNRTLATDSLCWLMHYLAAYWFSMNIISVDSWTMNDLGSTTAWLSLNHISSCSYWRNIQNLSLTIWALMDEFSMIWRSTNKLSTMHLRLADDFWLTYYMSDIIFSLKKISLAWYIIRIWSLNNIFLAWDLIETLTLNYLLALFVPYVFFLFFREMDNSSI